MLCFFGLFACQSTSAAVELRVGNVFAMPGGTVSVPVRLISDTNVVTAQFDLHLANTNLAAGDAIGGPALADHLVTSGEPETGSRRVVIYSSTNATLSNGILVHVPLTLGSNTPHGTTPLLVTNILLADFEGLAVTNTSGVAGSLTCTSPIPQAPVIAIQPVSQSVFPASRVILESVAMGQGNLSYQWRKNGSLLSGATDWIYTLPAASLGDAGDYTLVVTNGFGAATSQVARLTVGTYTVFWTGNGNGVSWNDPQNWSRNQLPSQSDEILIDCPGAITVTHDSGSTTINHLRCQNGLYLSGGTFTVTGQAVVNGPLTLGSATALAVNGTNASFLANGPASAYDTSLFVSGGGLLSLSVLTNYGGLGANRTLQASGIGSVLDLAALRTITGPQTCDLYLTLQAVQGGHVNLPGVQTIDYGYNCGAGSAYHGVRIYADGTNSVVDLSGLEQFNVNGDGYCSGSVMQPSNGGQILVPNLRKAHGLHLYVAGGMTFSLPALTNYDNGYASSCTLQASGAGSVLHLPALQTITGPQICEQYLTLQALQGGRVDVSAAQTIAYSYACMAGAANHGVRIYADGTNSVVDLASLEQFNVNGSGQFSGSVMQPSNGGQILVPHLRKAHGLNLYVAAGTTFSLPALTNYDSGYYSSCTLQASGAGSALDLPVLQTIVGPQMCESYLTLQAWQGGQVRLPAVRTIDYGYTCGAGSANHGVRIYAEGTNSVLDLSGLEQFNVNGSGYCSDSVMQPSNGGQILVPNLRTALGLSLYAGGGTTLSLPALANYDSGASSSCTLRASGPGSLLDLPGLRQVIGPADDGRYLYIEALAGGQLDMVAVTQIVCHAASGSGARGVKVLADGIGSFMDLSSLSLFSTTGAAPDSYLRARNGGFILLSPSVTLVGVLNNVAASIQTQPINQAACIGGSVTFTVSAYGNPPLHYQWRQNGIDLPGQTNTALTISNLLSHHAGSYYVVVTNSLGVATSQVVQVSLPQPLYVSQQGRGTVAQSTNATLYPMGQEVTLTATPGRWYAFSRWSDGNTNNPRTITIGLTNTYTAIFTNAVPLEWVVTKQWERLYGGSGEDWLLSIQPTADGGSILGGRSDSGQSGNKTSGSFGGRDYWLLALDANGMRLWETNYGGIESDDLRSLQASGNGGYWLAGFSASGISGNKACGNFGTNDYWIVKTDAQGVRLWETNYGGVDDDRLITALAAPDGGIVLGGFSKSGPGGSKTSGNWGGWDYWVVRFGADGTPLWERDFGGTGDDRLNAIRRTSDGGFLLGGESQSGTSGNKTAGNFGGYDYWLVKVDANGAKLWETNYGGTGDDHLYSLQPTSDGGCIVGGASYSTASGNKASGNFGGYDYWVLRLDANGVKLWETNVGGTLDDVLYSIEPTDDGGWLLGGKSQSGPSGNKTSLNYGDFDYWLAKLDANGNVQWDASFGGQDLDEIAALGTTSDGGYVLGGQSGSWQPPPAMVAEGDTHIDTAQSRFGGASGRFDGAGDGLAIPDFAGFDFGTNAFTVDLWVRFNSLVGDFRFLGRDTDDRFRLGGHNVAGNLYVSINGVFHNLAGVWLPTAGVWYHVAATRDASGDVRVFVDGVQKGSTFNDPGNTDSAQSLKIGINNNGASGIDAWLDEVRVSKGIARWTNNFSPPAAPHVADANTQLLLHMDGADGATNFVDAGAGIGFGLTDFWVVKLAAAEIPVGTPQVYVNGLFGNSVSNFVFGEGDSIQVELQTSFPDGFIYYSTDGSEPSQDYFGPFPVTDTTLIRAVAYDAEYSTQSPECDPVMIEVRPRYALTATTDGGGSILISPASALYLSNTVVRLTAVPATNWQFMYWTQDVSGTNPVLDLTMNSNLTVKAVFGTSVMTTNSGSGLATLNPPQTLYPYGSTVWLQAAAQGTGFFRYWDGTLGSNNITPLRYVVTNGAPSFTAYFGTLPPQRYSLSVLSSGPGDVTWNPRLTFYTNNAPVQIAATPEPGYLLAGWSGHASSTNNPLTVMMTTNKTITASFVSASQVPPSVAITNPLPGAVLIWPTAVSVAASASSVGLTVTRVDFYNNAGLLASATTLPYTVLWTNAPVGTNVLTAVAFDNAGLSSTSAPVAVLLVIPTSITAPPQNLIVPAGSNAWFSVTAAGTTPLIYQWRFNGADLAGATNASLTISNAQPQQSGAYDVVVSNPWSVVTSQVAQLSVPRGAAGTLRWSYSTGLSHEGMPAIGPDNAVYFGTLGNPGPLFALDGYTGRRLWSFTNGTANFGRTVPMVHTNGLLYAGCSDKRFFALHADSGSPAWSFLGSWPIVGPACMGPDGNVFIGSWSTFYCFDSLTGSNLWQFAGNSGFEEGFGAFGTDGNIYVGVKGNTFYSINGTNGQKRWEVTTLGERVFSGPALTPWGTVLFTSFDGKLYCYDAAAGTNVWTFATPGLSWIWSSPVVDADGTVYFGSYDGNVYAVNGLTGAQKWKFAAPTEIRGSPILGSSGELYITCDTRVMALWRSNGTQTWFYAAPFGPKASVALGNDGTLYGATTDGRLLALWTDSTNGLAKTPWPKYAANAQNTSRALDITTVPIFTQQPANTAQLIGGVASFGALVVGSPPITYQWLKDGQMLAGATSANLSISNVMSSDAGSYQVVAFNNHGSATSQVARLVVGTNLPPTITSQPQSLSVLVGSNALFTVTASGTSPLAYQWRVNGTDVASATIDSLLLVGVQTNQAGNYDVIVTNTAGAVTSSVATLTVTVPATPPTGGLIAAYALDGDATDSSGNSHDGTIGGAVPTADRFGRANHAFLFNGTNAYISIPYHADFDILPSGEFTIGAWVRIDADETRGRAVFVKGTSSWDYGLYVGSNGKFNAGFDYHDSEVTSSTTAAVGTWYHVAATYSNQNWALYVNGSREAQRAGADAILRSSHGVGIGRKGDAGWDFFRGAIDNLQFYHRALSDTEVLALSTTTNDAPVFVTQPQSQTVLAQSNVTFNASVTGMAPMAYQWWFNGGVLASATTNSLTLSNVDLPQVGDYVLVISNGYGVVTSVVATLTVNYALNIVVNGSGTVNLIPSLSSYAPGTNVSLTPVPTASWLFTGWGGDASGTANPLIVGMNSHKSILATFVSNSPPSVSLLAPTNAYAVVPPASIALAATAADTNGNLIRVDFYAQSATNNSQPLLLASVSQPATNNPQLFAAAWTNAMPGGYTLSAVAVDSLGLTATSAPVTITVIAPPSIITPPQGVLVLAGSNALFTVVAAGTPPLCYQWRFNSGAVANATNSSLSLSAVQSSQAGGYDVVVTNVGGSVTSAVAMLTINYALRVSVNGNGTVDLNPNQSSYGPGSSVSLTAVPATNWFFTGWTGDAGGAANPLTVLMTTNKTIWANFSTNGPPTVAITNPLPGATFTAPGPVVINATASSLFGTVVSAAFYAGTNLLGVCTNSPFSFTWANAIVGTNVLMAVATDNFGLCATSAPVNILVTLPPPGPPVFRLSSNAYTVFETNGSVVVTVLKSANSLAGAVNFTTTDGSALSVSNGVGNYIGQAGSLVFAAGDLAKPVSIPIVDNSPYYVGDRTFIFALSMSGTNSGLGTPSLATITIIDVNSPASTNSVLQNLFPNGDPPTHNGQLSVNLLPVESGGQWRLVRETFWRNSGDTVGNLASGNYEVEFAQVPNYYAPLNTTVGVLSNGPPSAVTNYYAIPVPPPPVGSLTVNLQPANVATEPDVNARGQWRLLGQTNWLDSGTVLTNLLATNQIIEFKAIASYATPPLQAVLVLPNVVNAVTITYQVPASTGCSAPTLLSYSDATHPQSILPYMYNGQLLSESGYGSGCAVKQRVVLTAAHVVFNDAALTYVPTVRWFFQRYAGQYEPPTQTARGWYVLGGYAAARTNDVNMYGPGVSSPASQSLDVAAVYLFEDAARGGQSGYLVSDAGTQWLQSGQRMVMVGYPVENVGEASRGRMFASASGFYSFSDVTNGVFRTTDICGYPGMSGGPLCVLYNGNNTYYPAAVYLGGSGETIVRAIDGAVADLINRADVTAHTGNNNTGGGVIRITTGASGSASLAYLMVTSIGPPAAIAAGGGWRVPGSAFSTYTSSTDTPVVFFSSGSATVEFKQVPGWDLTNSIAVQVTRGSTTLIYAQYTRSARLAVTPAVGLAFSGYVGGPFSPSSVTYTLTNSGEASLSWLVGKTANWLSLSASNGTLVAGAKTNITVSLDASANALAPGNYSGTVNFTNSTTGLGSTSRSVSLAVLVCSPVQLANPQLLANGRIAMTLQGVTNRVYSILGTTNLLQPLTHWTEVLRLTNTAGQTRFTNPPASVSPQFYRARELGEP